MVDMTSVKNANDKQDRVRGHSRRDRGKGSLVQTFFFNGNTKRVILFLGIADGLRQGTSLRVGMRLVCADAEVFPQSRRNA